MAVGAYRKNYPRPQFVREEWLDLNGEWDFCFDDGHLGERERWHSNFPAGLKIEVPFTYETAASGIGIPEFHSRVWYRRKVAVPRQPAGKRTILHFQGVDYKAKCWVNGTFVGEHEGAYAAFSFDITPYLAYGEENDLVLEVEDSQSCTQPRGKQRWVDDNFECFYVQTTGIWQSVWLEYVHEVRIDSVKMTPDIDRHTIRFDFQLTGAERREGLTLDTRITLNGRQVAQLNLSADRAWVTVEVNVFHEAGGPWKQSLWSPQHPNLFDVEFGLLQSGEELDRVYSYFGMRKISIENGQILLNNAPLYQKLILDQGYWPDSHLTPPSEEALIEDIDSAFALGYNGVRKHMKIEDARFLYWCDVKGMLVWSEMGAAFEFNDRAAASFTREWLEILPQQYNHPCIVTWVPFNESWGISTIARDVRQQRFTESIYHLTKAFDPYRPVITNDGWEHTVSDILTLHDYVESGEEFLERYRDKDAIVNNEISFNNSRYAFAEGYRYTGQPIIVSEFGGIAFRSASGWGYGNQVGSEQDFIERFRGITRAIRSIPYLAGYCYTQLADVQQEVNGLLTEDRRPKIPAEVVREING
ncbi:glycoside hydrolase family 2 TIM barrel-domain containing protein [Saccharibacillus sp. CPCC 101409]|uniref:glycoside hydrolase family 2 protein n=1 Tax=Saccharibacillus sp. CPCC 101409 TaxID=3058041 RepID=UPI00267251FD|nr:sugar-binding domain-containing protein [Saccharibacillus sp. CPCC 101409]MDO3408439.1 glycoside hydrolase family 2 TIM barrel-domain containing protein [Saccharibacillus sp. CPCC 101409]